MDNNAELVSYMPDKDMNIIVIKIYSPYLLSSFTIFYLWTES